MSQQEILGNNTKSDTASPSTPSGSTQLLSIDLFRQEFDRLVDERNVTWKMLGFCDDAKRIYSIGTDTKVISTAFEVFCAPIVVEIAEAHGYQVDYAKQTLYPDFTLTPVGKSSNRIAVDVKTTYQQSPTKRMVFTLGSYKSYLRNNTKNIVFPYDQYSAHWVLGFVYKRRESIPAKVHDLETVEQICPYENVRYFIQEKHRIAGKKPGSGNTANIGSFPTKDFAEIAAGNGPFAEQGEEAFEDYWRNY